MNKKEFLDTLYGQISGQLPEDKVAAHMQYYRNYIDEQIRSGHTEAEIFDELGDPRLIARTLLDTEAAGGSRSYSSYPETDSGYEQTSSDTGRTRQHSFHLDLTTWYGKLTVILIAAVVLILLFAVLGVLIPILLVAAAVLYVISYFKKRR